LTSDFSIFKVKIVRHIYKAVIRLPCTSCHNRETAKLAARRAASRKQEQEPEQEPEPQNPPPNNPK
jgi:hypothetical protein